MHILRQVASCRAQEWLQSHADATVWLKRGDVVSKNTGQKQVGPLQKAVSSSLNHQTTEHCPAFVVSLAGHRLALLPAATWLRASASRVAL